MPSVGSLVSLLELSPLPREGGWFRQYYLSGERGAGGRAEESRILFLISAGNFSALHRLRTAERWTHLAGAPVELLVLDPAGGGRIVELGSGENSFLVAGGWWQGAVTRGAWALLDCTMRPAWDEAEFELGESAELERAFPEWREKIHACTRKNPGR